MDFSRFSKSIHFNSRKIDLNLDIDLYLFPDHDSAIDAEPHADQDQYL